MLAVVVALILIECLVVFLAAMLSVLVYVMSPDEAVEPELCVCPCVLFLVLCGVIAVVDVVSQYASWEVLVLLLWTLLMLSV